MSFSMIASVSFLLMVSLMVNTVMNVINARLLIYFPDIAVYIFYIINVIILFATTTILFAIIFKTLPDGEIAWKDVSVGSSSLLSFLCLVSLQLDSIWGVLRLHQFTEPLDQLL